MNRHRRLIGVVLLVAAMTATWLVTRDVAPVVIVAVIALGGGVVGRFLGRSRKDG